MNTVKELAKKPVATNGTPTKPAVSPLAVSPTPTVTAKNEATEKSQSLDERLHRLNQLFDLQSKYNRLQDSLQKLNEFEIKKDGERSRLSLADDNRNDFSTYNPEIIKEVTDFLKLRIKDKIKAIEPLLKW